MTAQSADQGPEAGALVSDLSAPPWQSCYRTTSLLGGSTRFVLSTSGHIASMVNPPGNPPLQAAPGSYVLDR